MLQKQFISAVSKTTNSVYILSFFGSDGGINSITLSSVVSYSISPPCFTFNSSYDFEQYQSISLSLLNFGDKHIAEISSLPHSDKCKKLEDIIWIKKNEYIFPECSAVTFNCHVQKQLSFNDKQLTFANCIDIVESESIPSELLSYHQRSYVKNGG